ASDLWFQLPALPCLRSELHICANARAQQVVAVLNSQLHSNHLVNPLFLGLHVARQELRLLPDLLYSGMERLRRVSIHVNLCGLSDLHTSDLGFGYIDHEVKLVGLEQSRYGGICGK